MSQGLIKQYVANTAIARFIVVKQSSGTNVDIATAVTDVPLGVTDSAPDANERVDVVLNNMAQITAGAAIAVNTPVTVDGQGRVVAAAPSAGVNNWVIGVTREAATAVGDVIWVEIAKHRLQG